MKQQVIQPKTEHSAQGRSQPSKKDYQPKYQKPHTIIPTSDLEWSLKQKPSVSKLWQECWLADPYGSRWMQISTSLSRKHFFTAKKVLSQAGLFIFKREVSIMDGRETVCWMVRNLHGARLTGNGEFWSSQKDDWSSQKENYSSPKDPLSSPKDSSLASESPLIVVQQTTYSSPTDYSISSETTQNQGIREASVSPQEHLSNSSKEVLRCGDENISRAEGAAEFSGGEKQPRERLEPKPPTELTGQNRNLIGEDKCSAAPKTEKVVDFDRTRKGNSPVDVEKLKQENAYLDALKQDPEHQAAVKSVLAQCKQKLLNSPHLSQHCVEKRRAVRQVKLDQWGESLLARQSQTP